MEQRTQRDQPTLTDASGRLIDLVDRVMKRHPGKAKPRRNLFPFLKRDRPLVRPSLDRPSQRIAESSVRAVSSGKRRYSFLVVLLVFGVGIGVLSVLVSSLFAR